MEKFDFYWIGFLILTAISTEVKLFSALFQDTFMEAAPQ